MYILKVMLKYFWVKKMRLRNNPNALEIIKNSPNFISNPESYKGRWNSFFKNDNPIEIEIGMGKGNFIIKKAKENKNINYIGIEKYNSVLVQAIKKLGEEKIENLVLLSYDDSNIDTIFSNEVEKIYLNFSDPWTKARHAKRRLTNKRFLDKYQLISRNDVKIQMKTDNVNLFLYSKEELENNGFKIVYENNDYGNEEENVYKTEYEEKFIKKGIKINCLRAFKTLQ